MKRYITTPVLAGTTVTSETNRLYNKIFNMFIKPTAELNDDGTYTFWTDYSDGPHGFDPYEAKRIIKYALSGSEVDRPSDKDIMDEVLDNAVWKIEDDEEDY